MTEFINADWLDTFLKFSKALSPWAIGILTGYIAYQQWRTAEYRRRQDLFDKQFDVYNGLIEILRAVVTLRLDDMQHLTQQCEKIDTNAIRLWPADFLFDDPTARYTRVLSDQVVELRITLGRFMKCAEGSSEHTQYQAALINQREAFRSEWGSIPDKFRCAMSVYPRSCFSRIRARFPWSR